MSTSKVVCTVGIPMDLGQSRRGVDMGPSAVRYAGLGKRLSEVGYLEEPSAAKIACELITSLLGKAIL